MPSDIVIADQSQFGVYRPGNIVTERETGLRRSRSYGEINLATYNLQFTPRGHSTEVYEALIALLESSAVNALPFWVKEPISKPRTGVPGELTDGALTTFINPLDTAVPFITIGGEVDQTTPTQHASANLLTDGQANATDGEIIGLATTGTCTLEVIRHPVLDGQFAVLVNPTGSVGSVGAQVWGITQRPAIVAPNQVYTVQGSFLSTNAAHNYVIYGRFYDSTTGTGTFTSSGSAAAGEWLHLRATGTSASGDDTCMIRGYRTTVSADSFVVTCLGIAPGSFGRWFLPSLAPRLTEWASAPAADNRLSFASASCERWARVALARDRHAATMEGLGNTSVQRMALTEAVFTS